MFKEAMVKNGKRMEKGTPGEAEGARRATGDSPGGAACGGLLPGQRWSVMRKREVTLRLLRGESVEALSRELGVEVYRLEEWKSRALSGIDASLRERETTAGQVELDAALKALGELTMQNELLRHRLGDVKIPLAPRRSRR